jgi:hypothetical protein
VTDPVFETWAEVEADAWGREGDQYTCDCCNGTGVDYGETCVTCGGNGWLREADPAFSDWAAVGEWASEQGRECNRLQRELGGVANAAPLIRPILAQCRRVIAAHSHLREIR